MYLQTVIKLFINFYFGNLLKTSTNLLPAADWARRESVHNCTWQLLVLTCGFF